MENLIGKNIGRYHILEKLGEGGMAVVYKAFDTRLERDVAVKFIRTERIAPQDLKQMLTRFEREAKALARFHHPNIVTLFDYGEFDNAPYLIMEYLPGNNLKKLAGQIIPWRQALKLLLPVSEALAYAHKRDVLHRDVKPGNILFDENNHPKLADFGIAMVLESEETPHLTQTGTGVGTPDYMSPEQCLGNQATARSDVYALGIVLYELVTGRRPYRADTPMAVIVKQINDPLPRPRDLNPQLPESVENLLIKALAKDPNDRYADMQHFADAMQELLDHADSTAASSPAVHSEPPQAIPLQNHNPVAADLQDEVTRVAPVEREEGISELATSIEPVDQTIPAADLVTRVDNSDYSQRAPSKSRPKLPVWIWVGLGIIVIAGLTLGAISMLQTPPAEQATSIPAAALPEPTQTAETVSAVEPTEVPPEPTTIPPKPAVLPGAGLLICQVTDTSGFNDRSFNATTWQGIQMAAQEFGIESAFLESGSESDYEKNLDQFAQQGCNLIISSGFLIGDATLSSAKKHPDQPYSIVDFSYDPPVDNILSQTFRTNQASFLAGYLSAAMSNTGKVGTFGGMSIAPVIDFMDGFARGVDYYNQDHEKQVEVLGWDLNNPDAGRFTNNFDDPDLGMQVTASLLDQGADIIMPVAGQAGLGALEIARDRGNVLIIGVDSDWSILNPEFESIILTSVLKRMDQTTFYVIQSLIEGNFHGGNLDGTLANGGLDLAPFHALDERVPPDLREELLTIREGIISGQIKLD